MSAVLEAQSIDHIDVAPSSVAFPLSAEAKRVFLDALLVTGGHVSKAAQIAGCSRQNVLRWRDTDRAFALEFDEYLEFTTENLEEAAYARAMKTSDVLLQFLLKARRPEKYRENIKLDAEMSLSDSDIGRISDSLALSFIEAARRQRAALAAATPEPPTDT